MNSRIENGQMTLNSKEAVVSKVKQWLANGDIEEIYEETDKYISYPTDDGMIIAERMIWFPETDSLQRIKDILLFDEKAKELINPDKVAEFIYNCVDVNALAVVNHIAFVYDEEDELPDDSCRYELEERTGDEYAREIGSEELGIVWVERSAVIVNIGKLVETSEEIANDNADFYGTSPKTEFESTFKEGLVQTLTHEFRHLFYECNEYTPLGSKEYPHDGGLENNVEDYGNNEAINLKHNPTASKLINAMVVVGQEKQKEIEISR